MATFKGALKGKRKSDLLEIANELNLEIPDAYKRDDVETAIRDHLASHREQFLSDARFKGLYDSLDKSEKRSRLSTAGLESESDSNGSPQSPAASPKKHTRTKQTARRETSSSGPLDLPNGITQPAAVAEKALVDATNSLGNQLKTQTRKSLDNIASVFKSSGTTVRQEARDAVQEVDNARHTASRRTRSFTRGIENRLKRAYQDVRSHASDSGNLVRLLLAVEAFALVFAVLPTHYIRLGESKAESLLRHGRFDAERGLVPHWAITIPDVRGLITLAFWRPVILWTVLAVGVPSLAAHLVTFQRKHEPSPVTFTLVRLALLLFLGGVSFSSSPLSPHVPNTLGVAAGQPAAAATSALAGSSLASSISNHLSYQQWVPLDTNLQILGTALVAGISLYEAVAVRPRAA